MGKRDTYTKVHEDEICQRIAAGESLNSICKDKHMPGKATIMGWLLDTRANEEGEMVLIRAEFAEHYARARRIAYELMADGIRDIASDGTNDFMDRKALNGEIETVPDHEHIQRSRLRVDTDKWLLAKVLPKIYGDHVQVTQDVKVSGTIEHKVSQSMNFEKVALKRDNLRVVGSSGMSKK